MEIKEKKIDVFELDINKDMPLITSEIHSKTPYSHIINDFSILDQNCDAIDYNIVREHFINQGKLSKKQANKILTDSAKIFKEEPNVIKIEDDVHVIGDLHGQFYDLIGILSQFDLKKDVIIFLGNYINRRDFSTEVFLYLSLLKIHFPQNIFLLRGSHETKAMAEIFGFKHDCLNKYNDVTFNLFLDSFISLPLVCIVKENLFCIHGGLSPSIKTVDDIEKINRFQNLTSTNELTDLLWSDPHPLFNNGIAVEDFQYNNNRCCSWYYSLNTVNNFLLENNLSTIVRGHEVHQEGYKIYEVEESVRSIITIVSAPNLCGMYGNKGCTLFFDGKAKNFVTFESSPHPFRLKNNMDGLNLSFPFVSQKIGEFYFELLKHLDSNLKNTSDVKRVSLEKEMEKANRFVIANSLVRIERENLTEFDHEDNNKVYNFIKILPDISDFETAKSLDESNQIFYSKEFKKTGISINKIPSLKPNLVANIDEVSLEAVFHKSELDFDENKDVITIKKIATSSKGGVLGWCLN